MDEIFRFLKKFEKYSSNTDLLVAGAMFMVLAVMIIPLPPFLLDVFLSLSLAVSILILLISIYITKALEFSVFPSLLLITTLYRLALNVATTRLILTHGHQGSHAAGDVIFAFGNFVVEGNYVIGAVVFTILVIINFVVITKGSGRVAEVAARFTLDAMPGKQMAIDADLNAGTINEAEAKRRRKEIEHEADFYGAMDGASKFVRGDAIAGILITVVNIVGGLLIGVLQKNLDLATAAKYYTMLTIGDGLLAQIPALIISTAAGIVVTRNSKNDESMGSEIAEQLFVNPKAVAVSGAVVGILALVPGLPTIPFLSIGILLGGMSQVIKKFQEEAVLEEKKKSEEQSLGPKKENIESLLPLDMLELEVGYGLINVVETDQGGDLLERIASIRKQFALDYGIVVPSIHIRDNLQLAAGEYRVLIKGSKVAKGILKSECLLAMDPGGVTTKIAGTPTKEPAFGLDAIWISPNIREDAEVAGYTVVDLPTVIATHLTEVVRTHAHELLGKHEVASLLENCKKLYPKVVEDLIPDVLPLGSVVRVLQSLLKEQISVRDIRTILETLSEEATRTKDLDLLTEAVRKAMARAITAKFSNQDQEIQVMTLHPMVEELVSGALLQSEQGVQLVMSPQIAHQIINDIASTIEAHPEIASQPILLTSPTIRRHLQKLTSRFIPQLIVLSHGEVTQEASVKSIGTVELRNAG